MPNDTLTDTAPILFQWLPKNFGSSVPNNTNYPYLQRLVDWSEREPQRQIYLVINGQGLEKNQIVDLQQQLKSAPNIQVVDFSKVSVDKDMVIPFGKFQVKLSQILENMYNKVESLDNVLKFAVGKLPFSIKLDAMRLSMLLNCSKITGTEEAIYMDFDVLPDKSGAKLGQITLSEGILMTDTPDSLNSSIPYENSIIAINSSSPPILEQMIDRVSKSIFTTIVNDGKLSDDYVFGKMVSVIEDKVLSNVFNMKEDEYQNYKKENYFEYQDKMIELKDEIDGQRDRYKFQKNGGNIVLTEDNTWKEAARLYNKENLTLNFAQETKNKDQFKLTLEKIKTQISKEIKNDYSDNLTVQDSKSAHSKKSTQSK